MCQLLGMNCKEPTDIGFSFAGFRQRGGKTDHHDDGFGVAFFEPAQCTANNVGLRVFHDNKPCYDSPIADLINQHGIKALNVVAHIRKATQGNNCLANTHPFIREVWGEQWAFAHNGQMEHELGFLYASQKDKHYQPVGSTDSEMAFCYVINNLKNTFPFRPDENTLLDFIANQFRFLAGKGMFNCLLSNGHWQIGFCGSLMFYLVREAPFGKAKLSDKEFSINFDDYTTDDDRVAVLTTIPLTSDEEWTQLATNECVVFKEGKIVRRYEPEEKEYLTIDEGIALARKIGASV